MINWCEENRNNLIIACIHRDLLVEEIYDAAWSNNDTSGLVSVIYYEDGQGVVDEREAAKSIVLKMQAIKKEHLEQAEAARNN